MHVRQQIRDQIATTLTGLTTTGANVFTSRVYPHEQETLPSLNIFTTEEESLEDDEVMERFYFRDLTVAIEARAAVNAELDDTLDQIAEEVETAMAADHTVNSLAYNLTYVGTSMELSGEGDKQIGLMTITYMVRTGTAAATPGTFGG